jgi:hypothetical protein
MNKMLQIPVSIMQIAVIEIIEESFSFLFLVFCVSKLVLTHKYTQVPRAVSRCLPFAIRRQSV